jgi:molybdopterin molybdotransferase
MNASLLSLDDALTQLLSNAAKPVTHEWVSTFEADGRVLFEDLHAELNVPAFDNSAMDGYAISVSDWSAQQGVFQPGQRIPAGSRPGALTQGQADRIFTGAPVPVGADAVVMQEDCEILSDGTIKISKQPLVNQSIRKIGEDITNGACILRAGHRLNPGSLGLVASIGVAELKVTPRPRVALFSTGDELIMPGDVPPAELAPGAIYNSNRFFLRHLLERLGCVVTDFGILPDNLAQTKQKLSESIQGHDLILSSGGVSVGEEDHVKPAVQALGQLHLWALAIKPGKPFAYGQLNSSANHPVHFVGLPGNPVSSFVTFLLLVRPFVLALQGVQESKLKPYQIRADFNWLKADKRREFLRVRRNESGGLDLFPNQSSGVLTSAVWGDGLVDNPPGQTIVAGDMVHFIPFTDWLS